MCNELLAISPKGSLALNFLEPQSTECSNIWATPVLSVGVVLKLIENNLLSSSFSKCKSLAPLFTCSNILAMDCASSTFSSFNNLNP